MTFMQNLAANPSGSVYGQPKQQTDNDVLGIVNRLKDREMNDFKEKSNFMADLSNKQNRLQYLFNAQNPPLGQAQNTPTAYGPNALNGINANQATQGANGGMNTVMARDPNEMTGYQKGELSIRQQGIGINQARLNQQGKLGQQAVDVKQQQVDLNQQKSDQINAQKQADMERKISESDQKISIAQQALESKNDNAAAALQAHKDLAAAMEERHKLELEQKDAQFQKTSEQHQQTIDDLKKKVEQGENTETTTEVNADGTKKTVKTAKGDAANKISVTGKDGKSYMIPKNKLDDWNKNHLPEER